MGWASRLNNNPDNGKEKPQKPSKREIERLIKVEILSHLLNGFKIANITKIM